MSRPCRIPIRCAWRAAPSAWASRGTAWGGRKDAIPILEKAVAMHEESFGKEHAETGRQLTELGAAYRAEGRHEDAQKCLRRAMRIHQREQGIDSPGSIESLHHLAGFAGGRGRSGRRRATIRIGADRTSSAPSAAISTIWRSCNSALPTCTSTGSTIRGRVNCCMKPRGHFGARAACASRSPTKPWRTWRNAPDDTTTP